MLNKSQRGAPREFLRAERYALRSAEDWRRVGLTQSAGASRIIFTSLKRTENPAGIPDTAPGR